MGNSHRIALAGPIGVGKTTAARMIAEHYGLELVLEPAFDDPFLNRYYDDMTRWGYTLQTSLLTTRLAHQASVEALGTGWIQDRSLLEDPLCFARCLVKLGNMGDDEMRLYRRIFDLATRGMRHPSKIIYLAADDVETLQARIAEREREQEVGRIPDAYLRALNERYQELPRLLETEFGIDVLVFDTSNVDIRKGPGKEEFLTAVDEFLAA